MDCTHDLSRLDAAKLFCAATDALQIGDTPRRGRVSSDRAWMARLEGLTTRGFWQFAEACVSYLDIVDAAKDQNWQTSVGAASAALGVLPSIAELALRMTGAEHLPAHGLYQYKREDGEPVVELFPKAKAA